MYRTTFRNEYGDNRGLYETVDLFEQSPLGRIDIKRTVLSSIKIEPNEQWTPVQYLDAQKEINGQVLSTVRND